MKHLSLIVLVLFSLTAVVFGNDDVAGIRRIITELCEKNNSTYKDIQNEKLNLFLSAQANPLSSGKDAFNPHFDPSKEKLGTLIITIIDAGTLYIDGVEWCAVESDERLEIPLPLGKHTVEFLSRRLRCQKTVNIISSEIPPRVILCKKKFSSQRSQEKAKREPFNGLFSLSKFALIKKGYFQMGSQTGGKDEKPLHRVTIANDFYMGKYEVTQKEWQAVMGDNPSYFKGMNLPVESVSWRNAINFINRLNKGYGRKLFRLPTEAEWEYACRNGTSTPFHTGKELDTQRANFNGKILYKSVTTGAFREKTNPVGQLLPNEWGLYDMHGNVWELCSDWYNSDYYKLSPIIDPKGPLEGTERVVRGGSWHNCAESCRSANRGKVCPLSTNLNIGFRLVRIP